MTTRIVLVLLLFLCSCVSKNAALYDFQEVQYADGAIASDNVSVLLILVDGLPIDLLQRALDHGKVPGLKKFFGQEEVKIHRGHSIFPTTTYPNISSILTARPIGRHPILGNQMRLNGEIVNFEKPRFRSELNEAIAPLTIFSELSDRRLKSVSFAHYFRAGASVYYHTDIEAGLAYLSKDYEVADAKLIDSVISLFSGVPEREWPFFSFLHVAGVDSFAHDHGPGSSQVMSYLQRLDRRLTPLLESIRRAEERGKNMTVILTSDHGFVPFTRYFNVEKLISSFSERVTLLNETRYVSFYFEKERAALRENILASLEESPELDVYLERQGDRLSMESADFSAVIEYVPMSCQSTPYGLVLRMVGDNEPVPAQCPEVFDRAPKPFYSPFFVSSLAAYFEAPGHPDALLLAAPGVSFAAEQKGGHGGATEDEMLVPILLHRASIRDETVPLPTLELLKPFWRK